MVPGSWETGMELSKAGVHPLRTDSHMVAACGVCSMD